MAKRADAPDRAQVRSLAAPGARAGVELTTRARLAGGGGVAFDSPAPAYQARRALTTGLLLACLSLSACAPKCVRKPSAWRGFMTAAQQEEVKTRKAACR